MTFPALVPRYTLAEVFGPDVAYVARRSPSLRAWYPSAPGHLDYQSGTMLALGGGIPYIVHAACATPAGLALLAEAGAPAAATLHVFRGADDYFRLLSRLAAEGLRLAAQRPHPESELPTPSAVVGRSLLERLNNKGCAAEFVPPDWLAPRVVYPLAELPPAADLLAAGEPVVLKVATDFPTGNGRGVWICRTPAEIDAARTTCPGEKAMVVEQYLRIARTVCVHVVIRDDGTCEVPGVAEEITHECRYVGNWLDAAGDAVPADVLEAVSGVAAAAASRGYRGLAGIDVALCEDGSSRILDLNFRVNGSTGTVWLRPAIERTRGARTLRRGTWVGEGGSASMLRGIRAAVRRGTMVPLCIYDPDTASDGGLPRVAAILLGASRAEIDEEILRLASDGLT